MGTVERQRVLGRNLRMLFPESFDQWRTLSIKHEQSRMKKGGLSVGGCNVSRQPSLISCTNASKLWGVLRTL